MTTQKTDVNWEQIEAEYRAGIKSLRQIAQAFGVAESTIRKYAKKNEWTRDLNPKIHAKADAIVRSEAVRNTVRTVTAATEKQTIDANADLVATVRISHRQDIQRARKLGNKLFDELDEMVGTDQAALLQQLGELMYKPNDKGIDKLNDLYMKIIQLPNRVKAFKDLSDALKTLIGLESDAFGLNKEHEKKEDALTELLNRIAQSNSSSLTPVADDPEYQDE